MRVRGVVCTIAMLGIATSAVAGERVRYTPPSDALTLLMLDNSATFGSNVPLRTMAGFDASPRLARSAEPMPDTLARFDALIVPASTALPAIPQTEALSFTVASEPLEASTQPAVTGFDARHAVADMMADYPRPYRSRSLIDTMVTLRFDGSPGTRTVAVGGIAGVAWALTPHR